MSGPAPKRKEDRRNRNKKLSGDWVVLGSAENITVPKLPPLPDSVEMRWSKESRSWWTTVWASPMATQWQEADVPGLVELAMLRQKFIATSDFNLKTKLAPLVASRSDKFGLTPKGRKDLRWVITDEDAESAGLASVSEIANRRRLRATDR